MDVLNSLRYVNASLAALYVILSLPNFIAWGIAEKHVKLAGLSHIYVVTYVGYASLESIVTQVPGGPRVPLGTVVLSIAVLSAAARLAHRRRLRADLGVLAADVALARTYHEPLPPERAPRP